MTVIIQELQDVDLKSPPPPQRSKKTKSPVWIGLKGIRKLVAKDVKCP